MENRKNGRLDYIDVARGFVIILMLIGHADPPTPLVKAIFGFHMPFFFILSGLLYNKEKWANLGIIKLIVSKFKAYILPYFILTFLNLLINIPIESMKGIHGQALLDSTLSHIGWIFYSWGAYDTLPNCTPLWFLPCMFLCCIFFYLLQKIKSRFIQAIVCSVSVAIDYILYLSIDEFQLPWHINVALIGTTFMYIGFKLKETEFIHKISHGIPTTISMLVLGAYCIATNDKIDLCQNTLGNVVLLYIGAATISTAIIFVCFKYASNFSFIAYLGKNTIWIMAFNYAINSYSDRLWECIPFLQNTIYPWWLKTIIDIICCTAIIFGWTKLKEKCPKLKHLHI